MTSAVLPRMNESNWGHLIMDKSPYPNSHFLPNPNPMKKRHKVFHENGIVPVSPVISDAYQTSTSQAAVMGNFGSYVSFKVASFSKSEIRELRKRFSSELNQVRVVINRIESGQFSNVGCFKSQKKVNGYSRSRLGLVTKKQSFNEMDWGVLLKECGKILTKLSKHKFAYIFNVPVDAVALKLHDYHTIVKHPMDLGTVKVNLGKKVYSTPMEFAGDVRLTFNNALLYNPKTDTVNMMAEQMLACFEELFKQIQQKIDVFVNMERERNVQEFGVIDDEMTVELQGSSWNNCVANPVQVSSPKGMIKNAKPRVSPVPLQPEVIKKPVERMQQMPLNTPGPVINQQQFPMSPVKEPKGVGRPAVKQPKPRARDQNKRDMSMDEKQKLGFALQSVPEEKMSQLIQIIRKRNERFAQDGDEIELDIETLDTETLWELDRFVTNWKKFLSKNKRQSLSVNNNPSSGGAAAPSTSITETDMGTMSDKNDSVVKLKDNDEEDVDIDDDMPATNFPPVEIEKDEGGGVGEDLDQGQDQKDNGNGNASSCSSSSGSSDSDSSSSSDSDPGSSSGSDSDADEAQS